ncbi:hypothetical protein [Alkalibacterium pelagium]|nr:hypothetical protein [Alkalibacterium pelagium]
MMIPPLYVLQSIIGYPNYTMSELKSNEKDMLPFSGRHVFILIIVM